MNQLLFRRFFFEIVVIFLVLHSCSHAHKNPKKTSRTPPVISEKNEQNSPVFYAVKSILEESSIRDIVEIHGDEASLCQKLPLRKFIVLNLKEKNFIKDCANVVGSSKDFFLLKENEATFDEFAIIALDVHVFYGSLIKEAQEFIRLLKKAKIIMISSDLNNHKQNDQAKEIISLALQHGKKLEIDVRFQGKNVRQFSVLK